MAILNLPVEILKKLFEIFPYYFKKIEDEAHLNSLWNKVQDLLKEYFQDFDQIVYTIKKEGFYWKEEFLPSNLCEDFHKILYNEKTGAILIKKGIDIKELNSFFSIFTFPSERLSFRDQSFRLFFERKGFKNLKFFYIEEIDSQILQDFSFFINKAKALQKEILPLKEKKELEIKIFPSEVSKKVISEPVKKILANIFNETIISIISQFEMEQSLEHRNLLLQALRYIYGESILNSNFREVSFILKNLRKREEKELKSLYFEFQNEENIKDLIRNTKNLKVFNPQDFMDFYENLEKKSKKSLLNFIFEEKALKFKEEIFDLLVFILKDKKEELLEIYKIISRNGIQNFIYFLQKLPEDFLKEEELLSHPEKFIKAQILKICKRVPDRMLLDFLDSENQELRIQALSYIEKFRKESFVPMIISRIKREDFHLKERAEKEKFFETLAKIKNQEAISFLKELLLEHKLFPSQKREELRAMAAIALASTKDQKFKDLLERESKSIKNTAIVKEACKFALSILEESKK